MAVIIMPAEQFALHPPGWHGFVMSELYTHNSKYIELC